MRVEIIVGDSRVFEMTDDLAVHITSDGKVFDISGELRTTTIS